MGFGRALDGALGRAAVRARVAAALGVVLLLAGCKDVATIAGIASGSATGAATASPAVGFAVGVAVGTAGTFISNYYDRVRAGAEQDVIAETAGSLPVGGAAPWRIRHTIPIGNEHGTLRVVDQITTSLAVCRDVVFSVTDGKGPSPWYTVTVCRDPKGWKWATAEPAVSRWDVLR
jgi:hypothetical protein